MVLHYAGTEPITAALDLVEILLILESTLSEAIFNVPLLSSMSQVTSELEF
jgi:hypothetical protein